MKNLLVFTLRYSNLFRIQLSEFRMDNDILCP